MYEEKTNACGTVRSNRKGMPNFPKLKKNEFSIRTLDESDCKLLAIKWQDKRDVFILSSTHNGLFTQTKRKDKYGTFIRKPNCIIQYNKFMGLIDKCDMQLSFHENNRKTLKWYKKLSFHIFELMMCNAYILFKDLKDKKKMKIRHFRKNII